MARFLKFVALLVAVLGAGMLVQVVALDTGEVNRTADLGTPADGEALLGIDLADSVAAGQPCEFGPGAIDTDELEAAEGDIDSTRDVVVDRSLDFPYSLATDGCLRVEGSRGPPIDAQFDGSLTVGGDVVIEGNNNELGVGGPLTAGGDIVVDGNNNDIVVDGTLAVGGTITLDGQNNNIDADEIEEGADVGPPGSGQSLLTVTNQAGTGLDVTVTLEDPTAGDLSQGGTSGSAVSFGLAPGDSAAVGFTPDADLDGPVTVGVTATGADEADPITIELFRTVPTD